MITLVLVVVLACSLILPAFAASYDYTAGELNKLGLFQGDSTGYNLGRAPTRAEAVTMLIRLLGLEEEAKNGEHAHPFTDVPAWASPYVALAYELGYTTGTSQTAFSPGRQCTAQMYVTYILRALGYSDAEGDFTYAGAIAFGKKLGVVDDFLLEGSFLRGQMTAVSYLALLVPPKGGEYNMLLEKLISDGAVAAEDAAAILERLALLKELAQISSGLESVTNYALTTAIGLKSSLMGQPFDMDMLMDIKVIMKDSGVTAAIISTTSMSGVPVGSADETYVTDGNVYRNDGKDKTKTPLDIAGFEMPGLNSIASLGLNPLYAFSNIAKGVENESAVYTIAVGDGFMDPSIALITAMVGGSGFGGASGMSMSNVVIKIYSDSAGGFTKMLMTCDMSAKYGTMPISGEMTVEINITAVGDAVKITLPDDLNEYVLHVPG